MFGNNVKSRSTLLRVCAVVACAAVMSIALAACGSSASSSSAASSTAASTSASAASTSAASSASASSSSATSSSKSAAASNAASSDPKSQISFTNVKLELMNDWGEDFDTYKHNGRYLYKLTGTLEYAGTTALDEVLVQATCTEIKIDSYKEEVRNEGSTVSLSSPVTPGVKDGMFVAVQPGEKRAFEFRIPSGNKLEDPILSIYRANTNSQSSKKWAKEGDFTTTFTKGPIDLYGTGSAVVKNNSKKLYADIELFYYQIKENGETFTCNTYLHNVRPGSEYPIVGIRDEGITESGLLAVHCTEDTDLPAVSVDKEFSFTTSTNGDGDPVVKLTNKTGKYLSSVYVYATWVDNKGVVQAESEADWTMRPDEEREFTFEYEGKDGVKDFKVYDVSYSIDLAKEESKATSSSSSASAKSN